MRTDATISGTELLLGAIALRLAVLVLVGWGLTLLPRQGREGERACLASAATRSEIQRPAKIDRFHGADAALDDMLLHD